MNKPVEKIQQRNWKWNTKSLESDDSNINTPHLIRQITDYCTHCNDVLHIPLVRCFIVRQSFAHKARRE